MYCLRSVMKILYMKSTTEIFDKKLSPFAMYDNLFNKSDTAIPTYGAI